MEKMASADHIDYRAVRRYFSSPAGASATTASYMAHAQDLPEAAASYRFRKERALLADWLAGVPADARVLDLGCGAGSWVEIFASSYREVVGVEQSPTMLAAAETRLRRFSNVELVTQDVRDSLPEGRFDLVFFGGLCLYLSDPDTVAILRAVRDRLAPRGRVILRETTVPAGCTRVQGDYEAIYRSVTLYQTLFQEAGFSRAHVRRNYPYTYMEMAVELVDLRRRWLHMLPYTSPFLGSLTWWSLRAMSPLSFRVLPRALSLLGVHWPTLQNHFFLLESS